MRTQAWSLRAAAMVALASQLASSPASAIEPLGVGSLGARPLLLAPSAPAIDLPEMRSFQPRAGLQYGFRPQAPEQRGVYTSRPQIVMPKPVAPTIGYGDRPGVSLGYAYCADRPDGTLEPVTGPYEAKPLPRAQCP